MYVKVKSLSHVRLLATPWTMVGTYQAPPSMGFSRQKYWSGVTSLPLLNTKRHSLRVGEVDHVQIYV